MELWCVWNMQPEFIFFLVPALRRSARLWWYLFVMPGSGRCTFVAPGFADWKAVVSLLQGASGSTELLWVMHMLCNASTRQLGLSSQLSYKLKKVE
jgi:hypothetical protein